MKLEFNGYCSPHVSPMLLRLNSTNKISHQPAQDVSILFGFKYQALFSGTSKFEQEFASTSVSAPVKQFPWGENIATFYMLCIIRRKLFRLKISLTLQTLHELVKKLEKRKNNNLFCSVGSSQIQVVSENCISVKRQWEKPPSDFTW